MAGAAPADSPNHAAPQPASQTHELPTPAADTSAASAPAAASSEKILGPSLRQPWLRFEAPETEALYGAHQQAAGTLATTMRRAMTAVLCCWCVWMAADLALSRHDSSRTAWVVAACLRAGSLLLGLGCIVAAARAGAKRLPRSPAAVHGLCGAALAALGSGQLLAAAATDYASSSSSSSSSDAAMLQPAQACAPLLLGLVSAGLLAPSFLRAVATQALLAVEFAVLAGLSIPSTGRARQQLTALILWNTLAVLLAGVCAYGAETRDRKSFLLLLDLQAARCARRELRSLLLPAPVAAAAAAAAVTCEKDRPNAGPLGLLHRHRALSFLQLQLGAGAARQSPWCAVLVGRFSGWEGLVAASVSGQGDNLFLVRARAAFSALDALARMHGAIALERSLHQGRFVVVAGSLWAPTHPRAPQRESQPSQQQQERSARTLARLALRMRDVVHSMMLEQNGDAHQTHLPSGVEGQQRSPVSGPGLCAPGNTHGRVQLQPLAVGLQIGVACGPVLSALVGPAAAQCTLLGEGVRRATSLCDATPAGCVRVSGPVWAVLQRPGGEGQFVSRPGPGSSHSSSSNPSPGLHLRQGTAPAAETGLDGNADAVLLESFIGPARLPTPMPTPEQPQQVPDEGGVGGAERQHQPAISDTLSLPVAPSHPGRLTLLCPLPMHVFPLKPSPQLGGSEAQAGSPSLRAEGLHARLHSSTVSLPQRERDRDRERLAGSVSPDPTLWPGVRLQSRVSLQHFRVGSTGGSSSCDSPSLQRHSQSQSQSQSSPAQQGSSSPAALGSSACEGHSWPAISLGSGVRESLASGSASAGLVAPVPRHQHHFAPMLLLPPAALVLPAAPTAFAPHAVQAAPATAAVAGESSSPESRSEGSTTAHASPSSLAVPLPTPTTPLCSGRSRSSLSSPGRGHTSSSVRTPPRSGGVGRNFSFRHLHPHTPGTPGMAYSLSPPSPATGLHVHSPTVGASPSSGSRRLSMLSLGRASGAHASSAASGLGSCSHAHSHRRRSGTASLLLHMQHHATRSMYTSPALSASSPLAHVSRRSSTENTLLELLNSAPLPDRSCFPDHAPTSAAAAAAVPARKTLLSSSSRHRVGDALASTAPAETPAAAKPCPPRASHAAAITGHTRTRAPGSAPLPLAGAPSTSGPNATLAPAAAAEECVMIIPRQAQAAPSRSLLSRMGLSFSNGAATGMERWFHGDHAHQRAAGCAWSCLAFSLALLVFGALDLLLDTQPSGPAVAWLLRGTSLLLAAIFVLLRRWIVTTVGRLWAWVAVLIWLCQGALLVQLLRLAGQIGGSYGLSALLLYLALLTGSAGLGWAQSACATAAVLLHSLLELGSRAFPSGSAALLAVSAALALCAALRGEQSRREGFILRCSQRLLLRQCKLMERALLPPIFGQGLDVPHGAIVDALGSDVRAPQPALGPVDTCFAVVELDGLAALEARLEATELLAALDVLHALVLALCNKHRVHLVSPGGVGLGSARGFCMPERLVCGRTVGHR